MDETYMLYEENTHYLDPSPLLVKFLRFIRLMPPKGIRSTWKHALKIFLCIHVIALPMTVGVLGFIIKRILDGPGMELMTGLFYFVFFGLHNISLALIFGYNNEFENFLKNVSIYRFGMPRKSLKRRELYQKWNISTIVSFNLLCCGHTFATFYLNVGGSEGTLEYDDRYTYKMGFPAWYPFKIDSAYLRSIIVISRCLTPLYFIFSISLYIFFVEMTVLIGLRFQHLRTLLCKINLSGNVETTKKKLNFCIRYHNEILRFASLMDNSIGYMLAPEYFVMIILAVAEYDIILNGSLGSLFVWIIYVAGPISFCECGNMLEDQSERLRKDVYGMNWYRMQPEIRNSFKLFIGKVQKPVQLKAQPFMKMNRITLWNIMSDAANLLIFLKSFMGK